MKYDNIPTPRIDETVGCEPEVFEFAHDGRKYRAVLVGKVGRKGLSSSEAGRSTQGSSSPVSEPKYIMEYFRGADALGSPIWVRVNTVADSEIEPIISAIHAMRGSR